LLSARRDREDGVALLPPETCDEAPMGILAWCRDVSAQPDARSTEGNVERGDAAAAADARAEWCIARAKLTLGRQTRPELHRRGQHGLQTELAHRSAAELRDCAVDAQRCKGSIESDRSGDERPRIPSSGSASRGGHSTLDRSGQLRGHAPRDAHRQEYRTHHEEGAHAGVVAGSGQAEGPPCIPTPPHRASPEQRVDSETAG
jgi:hypothetical protein